MIDISDTILYYALHKIEWLFFVFLKLNNKGDEKMQYNKVVLYTSYAITWGVSGAMLTSPTINGCLKEIAFMWTIIIAVGAFMTYLAHHMYTEDEARDARLSKVENEQLRKKWL